MRMSANFMHIRMKISLVRDRQLIAVERRKKMRTALNITILSLKVHLHYNVIIAGLNC